MAQPLAVEGAIQFAERPLGRAGSDFFSPSTNVSVLIRTQRSPLPSLPGSSGICQCDGTATRSAPGKRASPWRPRGDAAAVGSAYTVRTCSSRLSTGVSDGPTSNRVSASVTAGAAPQGSGPFRPSGPRVGDLPQVQQGGAQVGHRL